MLYELGTLNLRELAEHLGGIDTRTARTLAVAAGINMPRIRDGSPTYIAWLDVFRKVHGIEPTRHADILSELKEPLLTIRVIAQHMGISPDAMKKREQRGRTALPCPIRIGTHRLWRPRDLRHWQLGEPVPVYQSPAATARPGAQSCNMQKPHGSRAAAILGLGEASSILAQNRDKTGIGPTPPS